MLLKCFFFGGGIQVTFDRTRATRTDKSDRFHRSVLMKRYLWDYTLSDYEELHTPLIVDLDVLLLPTKRIYTSSSEFANRRSSIASINVIRKFFGNKTVFSFYQNWNFHESYTLKRILNGRNTLHITFWIKPCYLPHSNRFIGYIPNNICMKYIPHPEAIDDNFHWKRLSPLLLVIHSTQGVPSSYLKKHMFMQNFVLQYGNGKKILPTTTNCILHHVTL